jgi:hypothetical protein
MFPIKIKAFVSNLIFRSKLDKFLDKHFYVLLLIPLIFIALPIAKPGISITGDFPYLDTPDYAINRMSTWIERGSIDAFEFLSRFPTLGLWYLLSFINVTTDLATKIMVITGFFLSSFSFYFSFLLFFKEKFNHPNLQLKLAALVGSLFYAYNVWSFNRVHHWYLWIGYSIFPLFFVSILFSFRNPKNWKFILLSIFLWSIASSTPHMAVFYGITLIAMALIFILYRFIKNKNNRKQAIRLAIPLVSIIFFYSLVNMYWIYPYFLLSKTAGLAPNYEFTQENLDLLSRESNLLNSIRVMAYWINSDVVKPYEHPLFFQMWMYASFVVPVVAFSSLVIKKSIKYSIIFSGIALVAIFLAMGTQAPINYYNVLVAVPGLSKFAWLFRDPDKLTFFIAFAYSFLIGIFSYKFLSFIRKVRNNDKKKLVIAGAFIFLLVGSISLSAYPFYKARMAPLDPVILPKEFDLLNAYLSSKNPDRVYFVPYPQEETQWDKNGRVASIYQTHSIKPSIESTEYNLAARNYYNFLVSSIMENRSKNIGNLIHPLGTSYLIFHDDTWSRTLLEYNPSNLALLEKMYQLGDIKNVNNIGFYKIFKTNTTDINATAGEVNIPSHNLIVSGGLDTFTSLNALPSFNSLDSSIFFLDDTRTKNANVSLQIFDALILDGTLSNEELPLSFIDDKYIVAPTSSTSHDDPSNVWSKSGTEDPVNADFHSRLNNLGIANWGFDFGKGLVTTKAMGENISIPIVIKDQKESTKSEDTFYLFMRYLKNQKGGLLKVYFDGKLVGEVDTYDKISTKFVWDKIGSGITAKIKGKHTLTLQNVAGFNAVNIFAFVPSYEMDNLNMEASRLLTDKLRIVYLMEAESNFYNNNGKDIGSHRYLLNENNTAIEGKSNGTFTKTIKGQFKVPTSADLVSLKFIAKNLSGESSYKIKDLRIFPAYKKYNIFESGFERRNSTLPLATLRQLSWLNLDKDLLSVSLETRKPLDGKFSLRADLKQGDKAGWDILSTDFIPINQNAYYNASLDISAKDAKQLHSRVLYFDSKKDPMTGATDYIFKGKDGTFNDTFASSILPPIGAAYLKYQVLGLSANPKPSTYLLDNVKVDEVVNPDTTSKNITSNTLDNKDNLTNVHNGNVTNGVENSTYHIIETRPIPVRQDRIYNYTITTQVNNAFANSIVALFKNSSDVLQNFTGYGNNASNGAVLSLSPGSEVTANLGIIKSSNYTIAVRTKVCESCTFLRVGIIGKNYNNQSNDVIKIYNIPLNGKSSGLKWIYTNSTYLRQGDYDIKVYSDSKTDLDSVAIFSVGNDTYGNNDLAQSAKLELFKAGQSPTHGYMSKYEKISPTKHVVEIRNATHPYMLAFAESYDPLWTAYSEPSVQNNVQSSSKNSNFKINSIPLYGVINGFYVNKTGNYKLIIEYESQKWVIQGTIISIIGIVLISIVSFFIIKQKALRKLYFNIKKK